ncbi:unnamed protein product [Clavelina lepadiformis]|uniref:Uncharacterized protein n=1 Tax=Clavelina lepadiformis TaxID=159417 RepID=A0ABP0F3Z1_CLALP
MEETQFRLIPRKRVSESKVAPEINEFYFVTSTYHKLKCDAIPSKRVIGGLEVRRLPEDKALYETHKSVMCPNVVE